MSSPKEIALSACRRLMEPIIGILLRNGVTYKDLSALCKQIYVSVASREFGIRGRDTNLSRVALLTGIDRKEVARIKDSLKNNTESDNQQHNQDRMTRMLANWLKDPEFIDANGKALVIPPEGDSPSFAVLARRYGGNIPAVALLKELKRSGSVQSDEQGNLHLIKRYYMPAQSDPASLLRAGSVLNDLGNSLYNNLYKANVEKNKPLHFEGRATNVHMPPETARAFRQFIDQEGQAFLEKVDAWLSANEEKFTSNEENANPDEKHFSTKNKSGSNELIRLGAGAYLIESNIPEADAPTSTDSTEENLSSSESINSPDDQSSSSLDSARANE